PSCSACWACGATRPGSVPSWRRRPPRKRARPTMRSVIVNAEWSRREWMAAAPAAAGAGLAAPLLAPAAEGTGRDPFVYCLNAATIRGQKLKPPDQVEVAAKAGYQAFEPWVGELDQYAKGGGSLKDLGQRIRDRGLRVESSIGFFEWIVDDPARRKKGLEEALRSMELAAQSCGHATRTPG